MKFLSFEEFCALPAGTIYQEYTEDGSIVDSLGPMIRADVYHDEDGKARDFVAAPLFARPADGDWGAPLVVEPRNYGRWGLFDYTTKFLVYDEEDRKKLAQVFLEPTSFEPD